MRHHGADGFRRTGGALHHGPRNASRRADPDGEGFTNTPLSEKKRNWIDFNAGILAQGADMQETTEVFFKKLLAIASGEQTQSEKHDYREIAIFKDGVTL